MSQIATGRGKWVSWEAKTEFDGSSTTALAFDDWANGTDYDINKVVKVGAKYFKCRVSHTSAATPAVGPTEDSRQWREVPINTVISLRSATLVHSTSQETATDLSEDQDPSISTELTGSVNLEFNYLYDDEVQSTFQAGSSGVCKIYPAGIGRGKPVWEFNADVSSVGLNIGPAALNTPVVLNMDGPLVRETQ